jgi:hypothetical protein
MDLHVSFRCSLCFISKFLQIIVNQKIKIRRPLCTVVEKTYFLTGSTTLCGSWPPPWVRWKFHNSTFVRDGVVSLTPNPQPDGPGTTLRLPLSLTCLAWVTIPGAYAPASIAFRVIGARKPPLHDKAIVLEEDKTYHLTWINFFTWILRLVSISQVLNNFYARNWCTTSYVPPPQKILSLHATKCQKRHKS